MKFKNMETGNKLDYNDLDQSLSLKYLYEDEQEQKRLIKEKKEKLNIFVWIYLKLRKFCVNPILFVNNKERMQAVLDDMHSGETQVRSSVEYAMLNDIKIELLTGKSTNENLNQQVTFKKMFARYLKLI